MSEESALGALVSTVSRLWPDATDVHLATSTWPVRGVAGDFLVVPNASAPRLLVPCGNPRAGATAMRRFSAGLSLRDATQRLGASAALRFGGPLAFRDRITMTPGGYGITSYLSSILGCEVDVSLGVGPARANRKPVLEVFNKGGRSLAYVKVGDNPVATRNVRGEAVALSEIAGHFDPLLEVPQLISAESWQGMFVLVMSSLSTSVRQNPKHQWLIPHDQMTLLGDAFADDSRTLTSSPLWHRMTAAAAGLVDQSLRENLERALAGLAQRSGDHPFRIGAWHGDWTPWNMARRGTRIQLWDWERFETGVPVGLDALHYGVNAMTKRLGSTPEAVRAGLDFAGAGATSLLAGVYLASITCRYAVSAEEEMGYLVSPRALLMGRELEYWLERTQ